MNDRKNLPQQNKLPDRVAKQRKAKRSGLGCSLVLALLLMVLGAGVAVGGPRLLALVNQTDAGSLPLNDRTSPEELAARRNQEIAQLNGYGWVDQAAGVAHIPITRAIALVAESGLPVGRPTVASETTTSDTASTVDLSNVSFQNNVLPIFQDRCSECHGADEPEEGLVLTSYEDVMLGSIYGSVVKPGDPDNSYLVEMITTGQMPKRGDDLTQEQIDTIIAWIEAGAPDN